MQVARKLSCMQPVTIVPLIQVLGQAGLSVPAAALLCRTCALPLAVMHTHLAWRALVNQQPICFCTVHDCSGTLLGCPGSAAVVLLMMPLIILTARSRACVEMSCSLKAIVSCKKRRTERKHFSRAIMQVSSGVALIDVHSLTLTIIVTDRETISLQSSFACDKSHCVRDPEQRVL